MRKIVIVVGILVAIAVLTLFFLTKLSRPSPIHVLTLIPSDTEVFVQVPDVKGSRARWMHTGLARIYAEPEVQAFLEKPRSALPELKTFFRLIDQTNRTDPSEFFLATTTEATICGFSFPSRKADGKAFLAIVQNELHATWPEGKSGLENYRGIQIVTFRIRDRVFGSASGKEWSLLATDVGLLKATLDRSEQPVQTSGKDGRFVSRFSADSDVILFATRSGLEKWIKPIFPSPKTAGIEAISCAWKFDGEKIHESVFVQRSGPTTTPLATNGIDLTTPSTALWMRTDLDAFLASGIFDLDEAFKRAGISRSDFCAAFGHELAISIDSPAGLSIPSALIGIQIRDEAAAREIVNNGAVGKMVESITGTPSRKEISKREIDGVDFYSISRPDAGNSADRFPITTTLAMNARILLLGNDFESVKAAMQRQRGDRGKIAAATPGKSGVSALAFLDLRLWFEKIYSIGKPALLLNSAFAADGNANFDLNKLPSTQTISTNLSPTTFSQTYVENGMIFESTGTLTASQLVLGTAAGLHFGGGDKWLSQPTRK